MNAICFALRAVTFLESSTLGRRENATLVDAQRPGGVSGVLETYSK